MTAIKNLPGGLNSGHLADTVEAALDAEDCAPLVGQPTSLRIHKSLTCLPLSQGDEDPPNSSPSAPPPQGTTQMVQSR